MNETDDLIHLTVIDVLESLDQHDSFEAAARLLSVGDSRRVIQSLSLAIRELLTQRKLAPMLWIGRTGIEYALREAHVASDAELRSHLLKSARTMSYNVSANLWPGWGDEAVHPTPSDLQAALDLARLHLRLVQEDRLGAEQIGNAHWLIGAQRLAVGQEQAAHHAFELAKSSYQSAGTSASEWMAEGYVSLALLHMGTMATEGQQRFDAAVTHLKSSGDDGEFFADQLLTARRVFLMRPT